MDESLTKAQQSCFPGKCTVYIAGLSTQLFQLRGLLSHATCLGWRQLSIRAGAKGASEPSGVGV